LPPPFAQSPLAPSPAAESGLTAASAEAGDPSPAPHPAEQADWRRADPPGRCATPDRPQDASSKRKTLKCFGNPGVFWQPWEVSATLECSCCQTPELSLKGALLLEPLLRGARPDSGRRWSLDKRSRRMGAVSGVAPHRADLMTCSWVVPRGPQP
jgi:hypothetical protein